MPNQMYGQAILFSCGHLTWDLVRLFFFDKNWSAMDKQMVFHHFVAGTGIALPLASGYGSPGIACNLLLTENSSVYLVVRNMIPKSKKGTLPFALNNYLFFATFSFFRMFLIPPIIFWTIQEFITVLPEQPGILGFLILWPLTMAICLYGLNCFWYIKILKVLGGKKV